MSHAAVPQQRCKATLPHCRLESAFDVSLRNVYVSMISKRGLGYMYGSWGKQASLSPSYPRTHPAPLYPSDRRVRRAARLPEHHRHGHPLGQLLLRLPRAFRHQHLPARVRILADAHRAPARRRFRVGTPAVSPADARCCDCGHQGDRAAVPDAEHRAHLAEDNVAGPSE